MDDTYFGLSRLEFIEIQNNSEFSLDYEWVKFQSNEEDLKEKEQWACWIKIHQWNRCCDIILRIGGYLRWTPNHRRMTSRYHLKRKS